MTYSYRYKAGTHAVWQAMLYELFSATALEKSGAAPGRFSTGAIITRHIRTADILKGTA